MPKIDPRGEVPNPIRTKLATEISRPVRLLQPSSTIVTEIQRRPDPVIAEEAVSPEQSEEPPPTTKLATPKKVLFTALEQRENDRVVRRLADAVGSQTLGWSHVNRALWSLLRRAQDLIEQQKPTAPKLARPSNGNPIELARFEDELAHYLHAVFKDLPRGPFA